MAKEEWDRNTQLGGAIIKGKHDQNWDLMQMNSKTKQNKRAPVVKCPRVLFYIQSQGSKGAVSFVAESHKLQRS